MYKSLHQYKYGGTIGFKDQYNVEETKTTGTKTLDYLNDTDKIYDFSVFVPPGTNSINIIEHCDQSSSTDPIFSFIISKTNQPTSEPKSNIEDVKALTNTGFKISDLTKECFGKNASGYIKFIDDENISVTEGFWLYVKILKLLTVEVKDISFSMVVDLSKYTPWYYHGVNWTTTGDPPSANSTLEHNKLPSGAYKTLKVTFSPTKTQKYSGDLVVYTDKGEFKMALSGEGYGSTTNDDGGGTGSETNSASVPKASILASEFYNYQDLDNNKLVYGYDFKITDDTVNKPPKKPIILCILEKSPYWANPSSEISWEDFLAGKDPSGSGTSGEVTSTTDPVLSASTPSSLSKDSGTFSISIKNNGVGTLNWTAKSDAEWITITSSSSGTGAGEIKCSYTAYDFERSGKITVTASSAKESPQTITIYQNKKSATQKSSIVYADPMYVSGFQKEVKRAYYKDGDYRNDIQYKYYKGFKKLFNYKDPVILCGSDTLETELCESKSKPDEYGTFAIGLAVPTNITSRSGSALGTSMFRYYIPKGTKRFTFMITGDFTVGDSFGSAIARFNKAPVIKFPEDRDYFLYPEKHRDYFPEDKYPDDGFGSERYFWGLMGDYCRTITELENSDYYFCNSDSHIRITSKDDTTNINKEGWLHVAFKGYGGSVDVQHTLYLYLDYEIYKSWYGSASWGSDGDPI